MLSRTRHLALSEPSADQRELRPLVVDLHGHCLLNLLKCLRASRKSVGFSWRYRLPVLLRLDNARVQKSQASGRHLIPVIGVSRIGLMV
jgi:hypothetical protein